MITFDRIGYMGRLGNQMFQFASTVGISKDLGFEARFPIENCFHEMPAGPFDPRLGSNEMVNCDLLECFEIDQYYFIPRRHLSYTNTYREIDFKYNQETRSLHDFLNLEGYFQTEKYFLKHKDHILSQFRFKKSILEHAKSFVDSNKKDGIRLASIHVRRGDYVMYPDHHPVCSADYYKESIADLETKHPGILFIVFSDDVDWCRLNFAESKFVICDLKNPYIEMCAMSLCDDHIIANSSFSWWGAWLNPKDDKTVIAPSRWFGSMLAKDTSDVYCNKWIKK
jgi:hypothetical protein